ncbi:hypothetical protein AB5N19_09499 [Seiridium cardinale]
MELQKKARGTEREQWCRIWKILFPGRTPPTSIYVDLDRSEDFCLLHEFSQQRGPTIVQEELDAHGLLFRDGVTNEDVQSAIRRTLDMIFEIFRESGTAGVLDNRHPSLSHPQDRDSNVRTSQPYTPGRSTTDSGIMVASSSSDSLQLRGSVSRNHIYANGNRQIYESMEAPELPERPVISWDIDDIQSTFAAGHLDIEGVARPETQDQTVGSQSVLTNYQANPFLPLFSEQPMIQQLRENDASLLDSHLRVHRTNEPPSGGVEELDRNQNFDFEFMRWDNVLTTANEHIDPTN